MKKVFQIITFAALSALPMGAFAQQDIQINASNIIFYEANLTYEIGLSENISISAFGGNVYGFPGADNYTKYWYLGPEFRYYVMPKRGIDRFYFGFYSRFKSGFASAEYNESGQLISNGQYEYFYGNEDVDYTKLAIGMTIGGKWVTRSGFVFGVFGGLGRNLVSNYDSGNLPTNEFLFVPGTYNYSYNRSGIDSEYWDFRVGFNIGYRLFQ